MRLPSLLFAAIVVFYAFATGSLIPVASNDIRMVDVFSVDEAGAAAELRYMLIHGLGKAPSFKYGSLFYHIPYALLTPFRPVSEQTLVIVFRCVGAAFGIACLVIVFILGRRVYGTETGIIAALFLAVTTTFLRWGAEIHPDLPQLFWMMLALYFLCRLVEQFQVRDVVLASIAAAFAFNTKYGGVFLLPIIGLAALIAPVDGGLPGFAGRVRARWQAFAVAAASFCLAVVLTNLEAVLSFDAFIAALDAERNIMSFGHTLRGERSLVAWLSVLLGLLGSVNACIVLVYAAYTGVRWRRGALVRRETLILLAWCVLFLSYVVVFSGLKRPRHLLPILPPLLLMAGQAYLAGWRLLLPKPSRWAVASAAVVALGVHASDSVAFHGTRLDRAVGSDELDAGRWIGASYPSDTTTLYDPYSYVPSSFREAFRAFDLTYLEVNHYRPDLLVVRDAFAREVRDTTLAAKARVGRQAFLDAHYFRRYLHEGRLDTYRLEKSFGGVRVFARTNHLSPRPVPWVTLFAEDAAGRLRGIPEADLQMAAWHDAAGEEEAALTARVRAEMASLTQEDLVSRVEHYLRSGDLGMAQGLFQAGLAHLQDASARAAVLQQVARSYFQYGHFEQAATEIEHALDVYGEEESLLFEHGVFQLANGNHVRADSILSAATARFGKSDHGRSLLRQLVRFEIELEATRQMLTRHFGTGGDR